MNERRYLVEEELAGERLDVAVSRMARELTRNRVQKLLDDGLILVNDRPAKANYRVKGGDRVCVTVPPVRETVLAAEDIGLDVLYEDDYLVVINKKKGMVVHPACGHRGGTLVNALLHHCQDLSGVGGEARPGIVHRLDKDTSGVLVVAKNDAAHMSLARQFKEHSIKREYLAVVYGVIRAGQGTVTANIARHPRERKKMAVVQEGKGRRAVTHYQVLERFSAYTYLLLRLETGRTHQIRVHLSSAGHPVVGDPVYGPKRARIKFSGQALHAQLLGFNHPADGRYLEFSTEPPDDFKLLLADLRGGERQ